MPAHIDVAIFGSTEAEIMQYLWGDWHGAVTLRELYDAVSDKRDITLSSVHTVLDRLVAKGFVERLGQQPYKYQPKVGREEVLITAVQSLIAEVVPSPIERQRVAQALAGMVISPRLFSAKQ